MAIDATPKGLNSDSWGTLAEADTYHESRGHNSEWTTATDAEKEKHLKWACRDLNRLKWCGIRTTKDQAQSQPRTDLYDYDGYYIDHDVVYKDMKNASFEYAFLLIKSDSTLESETKGIKSIKVAVISLDIDSNNSKNEIPTSVMNMIKPWVNAYGNLMDVSK